MARDRSQELLAHADALYNLARYLTGRDADAEDLVQETYSRALAAAPRLVDGSNVRAWLFQILRNTFISAWRHKKRDPTVGGLDTVAPAVEPPVVDDAMRQAAARDLEAAMLTLPEDARLVILLDLEGFTETEVAEIVGCAVGTVKSRLFRARSALRSRLAGYRT
jgi:RNA polymerase sigma-70 factor (ECF subfamily)